MKRLLLAALMLIALPAPAAAQEDDQLLEDAALSRASQIEAVMKGMLSADEVFSAVFLQAVPASQIQAISSQLVTANGPVTAIDDVSYKGNGRAEFEIVFERARAHAMIQLTPDDPYFVVGFRITDVKPIDDSPAKILEDLAALHGRAGFGVFQLDGEDGPRSILVEKANEQFAIGSTLKLYVLSALAREVKQGKRHWDEIVTLDAHSHPSGQMQNWPLGSPVTLHTLATLMISISDNTATDVLIRLLGRDAIAAEVIASGHSDPSRMLPFLATVEASAIKTGDPARIAAYSAADDAGQQALLDQWASTLTVENIDFARLGGDRHDAIASVEWFASAEDIARIFKRLRDSGDPTMLGILSINKAMSEGEAGYWDYVGYKGGSEPGVLNLSWLLKDKSGRWFVVSASWNDPDKPLDEKALLLLTTRLIAMLHQPAEAQ